MQRATVALSKDQSQAYARDRDNKLMPNRPMAGVTQQQGISMLDSVCMTTRGRSQPPTNAQAKRRHGVKGWRSCTKTPSQMKDVLNAGALNSNNKHTQSQDTDFVSWRGVKEERI
jgi:hypothetical protein